MWQQIYLPQANSRLTRDLTSCSIQETGFDHGKRDRLSLWANLMKTSILTGITLTLFMLLLVLAAAFLFLLQGRQTLAESVDTAVARSDLLEQELDRANADIASVQATTTAVNAALTTVEAEKFNLSGQLVAGEQETENLQATIEATSGELSAASAAMSELQEAQARFLQQPPRISIVSPAAGAALPLDEPAAVLVVAGDLEGVTAVNLTLNGEPFADVDVNDELLVAIDDTWTPSAAGTYEFGAMAVNIKGIASPVVTATVEVLDLAVRNAEIRDRVETSVIGLRGLEPLDPVQQTFLTTDELRRRIEDEFAEETTPEEMREDAIVLSAFDFMAADFDLYQALIDLQSESILGFYDPETDEFVLIGDDDILDVDDQFTHAHEYVHALQDQHYDLEQISDEELDDESRFALRALAEGDATLVQILLINNNFFSAAEIIEIQAAFESGDTDLLDELPPILVNQLTFPYTAGLEFVMDLYFSGGYEAVNAAWKNPPRTTEQILHVDSYRSGDAPQVVALAPLTDTLGTGWRLLDQDVLGEFGLREYLSQQLDETAVDTAAAGWGGDQYAVYWQETDEALVMALRLAWDAETDAAEFAALYSAYPTRLFGVSGQAQPDGGECWLGPDVICLFTDGAKSLVVRAPDVGTAVIVAGVIRNP